MERSPELQNSNGEEPVNGSIAFELLKQENKDLKSRITELEQQIGVMAAEMSELKSMLADAQEGDKPEEVEQSAEEVDEAKKNEVKELTSVHVDMNNLGKGRKGGDHLKEGGKHLDKPEKEGFFKRHGRKVLFAGAAALAAVGVFAVNNMDEDSENKLLEQVTAIEDEDIQDDSKEPTNADETEEESTEELDLTSIDRTVSEEDREKAEDALSELGIAENTSIFEGDWNENVAGLSPIEAGEYSMNRGGFLEAAQDGEASINDSFQVTVDILNGEHGEDIALKTMNEMIASGWGSMEIIQLMNTGEVDGLTTVAFTADQAGVFEQTPYFSNGEVDPNGTRNFTEGDMFLLHMFDDGRVIVTRVDCGAFSQDGNIRFFTPETPQTPRNPETPPTTTPEEPEEGVTPKEDDGELPGSGIPADQDPGTPDVAGEGPAGQETDEDGYVDGEDRPEAPEPDTFDPETEDPSALNSDGEVPTTTPDESQPEAPTENVEREQDPENTTVEDEDGNEVNVNETTPTAPTV